MISRLRTMLRRRPPLGRPSSAPTDLNPAVGNAPFSFVPEEDPPQDAAVRALLNLLRALFDDPAAPPLPEPLISLVEINEKPVGLGNRRGTERRLLFNVAELKGLRLDTLARFQLRFADQNKAEAGLNDLNIMLLNKRDELRRAGVLRLNLESVAPAELAADPSGEVWRIIANFRLLYEYHYQDSGGAESLIARIPIDFGLDEGIALTTTVTDEIVRWDNQEARALQVTGATAGRIGGLAVLAHPPEQPTGGQVTLARLDLASGEAPSSANSLLDFVQKVMDPVDPATNIQFTDCLERFLQAEPFSAVREGRQDVETEEADELRIELGGAEGDGVVVEYGLRVLPFGRPLELPRPEDVLRLAAQFDSDSDAVLYIRASRDVLTAPIQPDSQ